MLPAHLYHIKAGVKRLAVTWVGILDRWGQFRTFLGFSCALVYVGIQYTSIEVSGFFCSLYQLRCQVILHIVNSHVSNILLVVQLNVKKTAVGTLRYLTCTVPNGIQLYSSSEVKFEEPWWRWKCQQQSSDIYVLPLLPPFLAWNVKQVQAHMKSHQYQCIRANVYSLHPMTAIKCYAAIFTNIYLLALVQ